MKVLVWMMSKDKDEVKAQVTALGHELLSGIDLANQADLILADEQTWCDFVTDENLRPKTIVWCYQPINLESVHSKILTYVGNLRLRGIAWTGIGRVLRDYTAVVKFH